MRRNIASLIILCLLMIFSFADTEDKYNWLDDLKGQIKAPPCIISRPDGGYVALWFEREQVEFNPPISRYFFRIVDPNGSILVPKTELDFWRCASYNHIRLSVKSALWVDQDKLLLLGWRPKYLTMDPISYFPEVVILSISGEILYGPDTLNISWPHARDYAMLLKTSNGNVYAVEVSLGLRVIQVYPEYGQEKSTTPQNLDEFMKHKFYERNWQVILSLSNTPIAMTSDEKLLICGRIGWGYTPLEERGKWDIHIPNKVFYVLADLEGNFVSGPTILQLEKDSFRKIPGIHLGGMYSTLDENIDTQHTKVASGDWDLTSLASGDIILSVTAPNGNNELAVYQFKFTEKGVFVKPAKMDIVKEKPFPKNKIVPVTKCASAQIWPGRDFRGLREDLVLFGFDEDGNFYSEREIWR